MELAVILAALKKFGGLVAKNWKVAVAIVLLVGIVLFVRSWYVRGVEIDRLKIEVAEQRDRADRWEASSKLQSEKALEAARLRDEFERRLAEELAKPPEVIVRWRETAADVPTVVDSAPDCGSAVRDLGRLLKGGGS